MVLRDVLAVFEFGSVGGEVERMQGVMKLLFSIVLIAC